MPYVVARPRGAPCDREKMRTFLHAALSQRRCTLLPVAPLFRYRSTRQAIPLRKRRQEALHRMLRDKGSRSPHVEDQVLDLCHDRYRETANPRTSRRRVLKRHVLGDGHSGDGVVGRALADWRSALLTMALPRTSDAEAQRRCTKTAPSRDSWNGAIRRENCLPQATERGLKQQISLVLSAS